MAPIPRTPSPAITHTPTLTLSAAKHALSACERKAHSLNLAMNIAITSSSTHLLAFSRMDGAKLTSIPIAIDKAFTAAGHRVGTHTYKEAVWPGGAAYGLAGSNQGRFMVVGGGLPVVGPNGEVLGAVGVSAGTPAQDREVAQAGVDAVVELLGKMPVGEGGKVKAKL